MQPLDRTLRNRLESTVKEARDAAEQAARAALGQLGVGEAAPFDHLSESDKDLRRRLRIHGRQLGDSRDAKGEQAIDRLVEEAAYEHWHRMLFARFLAENNLLMYPDPDTPVAVTLEECDDLAADEGAANGWELAARFAARMLPQIFRPDSPVFRLTLPPERQQKLERLLADLPREVFTASDSLGWVYQFWQAKKKEDVNASEVKIGARELPAVTQLFTEPYMVSFLLDNSLGAWWAARRLTEADLKNAGSEEELRRKAALPGAPLEYLRFVRQEDGAWTPAAGTFDGWPERLADLKTLDPCCGSGHFLVAALLMLTPMRMERDRLSAGDAVDAVLRENLHGLDIDQRVTEIAAFALALAAWKYPNAGGYRVLPELNVSCSGLSISAKKEEWLALAGNNANLQIALEELYKQFKDAPVLGSLINPEASLGKGSLFDLKWEEVGPLLTKALAGEKNDEKAEMGIVAKGLSNAALVLGKKFRWVITNVPYLGAGKQNVALRLYSEKHYPDGKADLSNIFLERCLEFLEPNEHGLAQIVMPENWLFLYSYTNQRTKLLRSARWNFLVNLGGGAEAFECGPGNAVNVCSIALWSCKRTESPPSDWVLRGVDLTKFSNAQEKAIASTTQNVATVLQRDQLENPDARVHLGRKLTLSLLSQSTNSFLGLGTGDFSKFGRNYWEFSGLLPIGWERIQCAPENQGHYGGNSYLIAWDSEEKRVRGMDSLHRERIHNQDQSGQQAWGKSGISVALSGNLKVTIYSGALLDKSLAALIPFNYYLIPAIFAYSSSKKFLEKVREIDKKIIVANGTLIKVPFDIDHWTQVAEEQYPNGLPKPYTDDPTQWIFHGHPCGSVIWDEAIKWTAHGPLRTDDTVLQVAVARLLGYRWPAELDAGMELADEQREWVNRCEALTSYADNDGIVCIPPIRGESSASDRLLNLLAAAYGDAWSNDTLAALLKSADHADKTLETWLREKFFARHCKLFQHRPFIWHIWDGLRDGFAALVNYHKLDAKLLETLTYTYLGDWITRQRQEIVDGVDGARERRDAAESLKKKLELILEGEAPYDIFVRWKPLEKQPIGWDPDINDGVRLNIRPFMTAGVLRENTPPKLNIKWEKDRGKDVESAPWHYVFKGDRINDWHLTLAEKKAAREVSHAQ